MHSFASLWWPVAPAHHIGCSLCYLHVLLLYETGQIAYCIAHRAFPISHGFPHLYARLFSSRFDASFDSILFHTHCTDRRCLCIDPQCRFVSKIEELRLPLSAPCGCSSSSVRRRSLLYDTRSITAHTPIRPDPGFRSMRRLYKLSPSAFYSSKSRVYASMISNCKWRSEPV